MRNSALYIQLYSSSPAPKRDYNGLTITSEYITLNSWDISHGPHVFPRKLRTPLCELQEDELLQRDIRNLFGTHVLEYALAVCRGEHKLHTLPNQLFLAILRLLAANDIIRLGQSSKIFFELCNSNPVWKIIYKKRSRKSITNQELSQAEKQSWRYLLKKKLTAKLALMGISENFRKSKNVKPDQKMLDEIEYYSKPIVHKKRPPPSEIVPKLDIDIDFKSLRAEKSKTETLPKVQKKTVKILTPKSENPFKVDPSLIKSPVSKTSSPILKWTSTTENSSKPKNNSPSLNRGLSSPTLKSESPKIKNEVKVPKNSSPVLNERSQCQSPNSSPIIRKRDIDLEIRKVKSPQMCQSPKSPTSNPNLNPKEKTGSQNLDYKNRTSSPNLDSKNKTSSPNLDSKEWASSSNLDSKKRSSTPNLDFQRKSSSSKLDSKERSPNLVEKGAKESIKVRSEHLLGSPKIDNKNTKLDSGSSSKLESPKLESPKKSSQKTRTKFTMLN